jgi:hypothetical protein
MKRILAILLLAIPIATFAQFRIVGEGLFTTVNDSTYRARVNFRTDLTGNSYNPTQLDTTMFVLSQRGQFYRLDSFYSQDFSSAFIVIVEKNGNWGSPSGQIMIFKNTGSIAAPQTVYAVNGATAAMQAQVDTWNSKLIKSLLDSVPSWNEAYASMIDSISFSGVDTIALTMYQRDGDSLTASFKIQPFLSAKFLDNQTDADTAEFQYNYDIGSFVYGANDLTQIPVLPGHWFVRNDTNITLTKGTIVMASGTIGASGRIKVLPLIANGTVDAKFVLGVVAKDIAGDADGYVMFYGKLRKMDTSKYPEATVLYANPDTAGAFTAIEPSNGDLKLPIAFVVHSHPTNGVIAVRVAPGSYLRDLHDVDTSGVVNGSVLRYIDSLNYWRASASPGVLFSDTLSTIATKADVAVKLDSSFASGFVKYTDTLTTIATKANVALKLNAADTASLSNRINLKLNASDTVKYVKYVDTLTTIATKANVALKLNAADTASLSNRINLKLNASDTVKYVKYVDTLTTIATKYDVGLKLDASDTVNFVKYTDTTATIATKTDLNLYQQKLTLVTNTRTEGAATLIGNTLNIPNYADTSIYREDGTLSSNRTVNLDSKTISFVKSASATTEYVRIGDKTVKVTNASQPILIYETTVDPAGIQNSTGTFDSRVDMLFGTVTIRGNDAVDAGGTTSDIYVDANGKVKFRVNAGGTVDSVYGKNQFGELALTTIKAETPQDLTASLAATNAAALDLSTQGGSAGEAIIVVDANNATPWDGFAVVGIVLQYQSRVIFTGQGGILVSTAASAYADTVKVAADTNFLVTVNDTASMLSTYFNRGDTIPVANGGTGLTTFGGAGRVPYSTGATGTGLQFDTTFFVNPTNRNFIWGFGARDGTDNVYIGGNEFPDVFFRNGNGIFNIGIGSNAGNSSGLSAVGNISLGRSAGRALSTGDDNIFMGRFTGAGITTGSKNIYLGSFSGFNDVTGSNNIAIGDRIYTPIDNGDRQLTIGNLVFGINMDSINKAIPVNGKVGIKVASPTRDLHVSGEMRVTDLDSDVTPTRIVGADATGVFDTMGIGTGLGVINGSLQLLGVGLSWIQQSAAGNNDFWWGITYANNQFVAVGGGDATDRVMTSPDGVNWTARSAAGNDDTWRSVVYGNGLYVAVGDAGGDRVMTSPDGITWTARSAAGNNDKWNSVAFGNNRFVAVSYEGDRVMTSPDGITWTVQSAAGNNDTWYSVTYGNNQFVAVGGGTDRVMTSPDGITWTVQTAAQNNSWYGVTYGNGLYVAVSEDGTDRVMTSSNGSTWTARSTPGDSRSWNAVSYGEGKYIAVATNSDSVMVSENGTSWSYVPSISGHTSNYGIAYGNGIFAAVGTTSNRVMTSGKTTSTILPERRTLVAQDSLDFSSISAGASQTLTITVSGAELSDPVSIGIPNNATTNTTLIFSAFVSASNTVSVRCYNSATSGSADADKGLFKVIVHKY